VFKTGPNVYEASADLVNESIDKATTKIIAFSLKKEQKLISYYQSQKPSNEALSSTRWQYLSQV
jgi:hypothetical protein